MRSGRWRSGPGPGLLQPDTVELVVDIDAGTAASAVMAFQPYCSRIVDLVAFQMAAPLGIDHVRVIAVTPPVFVGDQREMMTFGGSPFDRHARAREMEALRGRPFGELPETLEISEPSGEAVLRWFVKSLETDALHDQFIFLWIALEILCDASKVRIEEPYKARCGHLILHCPECAEATTKVVRGATLVAFLSRYGVESDAAKALWRLRQMMHGAFPFDSKKLEALPGLVQELRAVVAIGLKEQLGIPGDAAPIVSRAGLSIAPWLAASGHGLIRKVDIDDLESVST